MGNENSSRIPHFNVIRKASSPGNHLKHLELNSNLISNKHLNNLAKKNEKYSFKNALLSFKRENEEKDER